MTHGEDSGYIPQFEQTLMFMFCIVEAFPVCAWAVDPSVPGTVSRLETHASQSSGLFSEGCTSSGSWTAALRCRFGLTPSKHTTHSWRKWVEKPLAGAGWITRGSEDPELSQESQNRDLL